MSAKPFLITGLPQTRMEWMSVFCTPADCLCLLEPPFFDVSTLKGLYVSEHYKFIGIASSKAGHSIEWMLENVQPRTLIVERDAKTPEEARLDTKLQAVRANPLVMWVPIEALDRKRVLQKIYWHLMPGHPFDEERYNQLERVKIEARAA